MSGLLNVAGWSTRAIGAVGSALPSHGRGHRFESGIAHHRKPAGLRGLSAFPNGRTMPEGCATGSGCWSMTYPVVAELAADGVRHRSDRRSARRPRRPHGPRTASTSHQRRTFMNLLDRNPLLHENALIGGQRVAYGVHGSGEPVVLVHGTPSSSDRKSTRLNSSHVKISYAVFCLKK